MNKIFGIIALTTTINRMKNPKNFLWDMLIGEEKTEKTNRFEVHFKDAQRKRAPLVGKRDGSVFIEKGAFEVNVYEPAWIKLHTINQAEEMLEQKFGQSIYADGDKVWKEQLAEDLKTLKETVFRTKNWMLAELIKTGACPVAKGSQAVKFGDFAKVTLSGTETFDDENSDPIAWIKDKQLEIQKATGMVVDTIITTPDVEEKFLNHPKVKEYLKECNANSFRVNDSETREDGGRLVAYIPRLGINIYTYVDWIEDEDGTEKPVIEEKHLILCKKGGFRAQYGALPLRAQAGERAQLFKKKEVVRTRYPENSEDEVLEIISAPLLSPRDAQGWVYAQVLK